MDVSTRSAADLNFSDLYSYPLDTVTIVNYLILTCAPNDIYSGVERTQYVTVEEGKSDNSYNYKHNFLAIASS